ncbi:hypothetical protein SPRG_10682 [Saprolegnia parasitica CBS 223.65]|uniref:Cyclin N-terminal domain-containing protein n=1 Tax=Saprolegnia parasitica (strain CBS 223.65) TaxID=695850 RepID=A0A067C4B7_SAPPC|nr:hypothetical protein SPRG_10682 [Saprolegnia parasitica CBS 223.65]KDO23985.1 hypothetical protein SPRG_10682 [Saprolegnia parasitica CBS 223.65]|eukprot:XP_012205306.1 hypothetical protein SPRG_10682 [Saprolegnia parasitica CBS 223.65]
MELCCDEELVSIETSKYLPLDDADLDLADDWYTTMLHQERLRVAFNPSFHYVQTRRVLVDWTCDVGDALHLEKWIVHTAVVYLDRILSEGDKPPQTKLQLYCLCCLYIAAKTFALDSDIPSLDDMHAYANGLYSTHDIKLYEARLLQALHWSLTALHPLSFVRFYVASAPLFPDDAIHDLRLGHLSEKPELVDRYSALVEFLADLCLSEYAFLEYLPSVVATAILAVGRRLLSITPVWRAEMEALTGYAGHEIEACYHHVYRHYEVHGTKPGQAETSPTAVSEL